jgi:hypothetical protein
VYYRQRSYLYYGGQIYKYSRRGGIGAHGGIGALMFAKLFKVLKINFFEIFFLLHIVLCM